MAFNVNSNLLLGAGHYQANPRCQKVLTDHLVHSIENMSSTARRTLSAQSLQTTSSQETSCATPTPTTSTPHPHFPEFSTPQVSTMKTPPLSPIPSSTQIPSSTSKSLTHNTSLRRIDNICSRRASIQKARASSDSVHFPTNKFSNEYAISSETKEVTLENQLIKKQPIEIRVRCIFSRVGEIDTLNERYTAEFFFEASWYDESQKIGTKYDPQMGHFNPQLVVLNHLGDSLKHEKWYSITKTTGDDTVEITEHHKIRGVFWERMELNHFPYDVQELSLSITTPLTTDDIYFMQNKEKLSGVNRIVFSDEQSWHLYEHVEFTYEQHCEEYSLNQNQVHPVVVCTCHVGRKCGYYIWNAYFLIFLITSAALCTFAIPPSNTQGRLQITCTLLLTSVTFRWVVNKSLPPISYLTALDVYAISSIVALCIINVFHGVISYFYYTQIYLASSQPSLTPQAINVSLYPEYSLCRLDRYAFFIFCSSFFLYQVLILLCTLWVPYRRRLEMSRKDEEIRTEIMHKTTLD
ncbi:unnamed protein product [Rotaria magnacalcarata]|uniref:Uncharacterized protein n=4 Tax=Rotaria magnacalcarata TaxID=392030 RepID=A0A814VVT0_9BILA|nr:unnamed protein product [Rotaria magnacalcarata]CAF1685435.1 unnamed protein product [Rotaria magnacalcarata]CAF1925605.1 unnamed protein product [Rotaria magnacalcarata]CAF3845028.1 unnamed protein product [Rotaria magnacalcarata]CAF4238226.1 unnamed protein product [Rotaria magnacalcarata]